MHKGRNYPIMNIQERVLGLLSCRFVDEVVIGAPWEITSDMITTFNISSAPTPPPLETLVSSRIHWGTFGVDNPTLRKVDAWSQANAQ